MSDDKKRVLFVCTGNRARSQMGEGLLRHLAGDRFDVHSAGTLPSRLAEETIAVMLEIGVDVSGQRSQHVREYAGRHFDYVITVCDLARQECPVFPGSGERIHWSVEDPSDTHARGETLLDSFRVAREDLRRRIEAFVRETRLSVADAGVEPGVKDVDGEVKQYVDGGKDEGERLHDE